MGYNRGDTYEEHIYEISKNKGIVPPGSSRAGAAANAPDLLFRHLGKDYKLEIKHNITNPDYEGCAAKKEKEKYKYQKCEPVFGAAPVLACNVSRAFDEANDECVRIDYPT